MAVLNYGQSRVYYEALDWYKKEMIKHLKYLDLQAQVKLSL